MNSIKTIFFLFSIVISAQNIKNINADLNLPDSLIHNKEVRVYYNLQTTNYASVFRMYKNNSGNWIVEFFEHFAKVNEQNNLRIKKQILNSKNETEFIFQNLIKNHILDLPNKKEIEWKLIKYGKIEKIDKKLNQISGITSDEYDFAKSKISTIDGKNFKIHIKNNNKYNEFEYSNPEIDLKYFPEVDELIYVNEIINLIKTEFGIWKE